MELKNQVQLITYPDSLGGDLITLNYLLKNYFSEIFKGGVHILPPFPSSGDRGFAPIDYFKIDSAFGTWDDVKEMGKQFDVLLDLMVNHISKQSKYFQDFLDKGEESKYADMFIMLDKIWKDGEPVKKDIEKIFLRREKPYSTYRVNHSGKSVKVWTTFGREEPSEQIDLDIYSPKVKEFLTQIFEHFSKNHIKIIRLDAVGYVVKKLGTSCFFVEPEIYDFLDWIKNLADSFDMEILPEVHADYSIQFKLAERGFWIYDFILPYTVLEALINNSSNQLKHYLKIRPSNQFTMLDCHDGIPVLPDLEGFLDIEKAKMVVKLCVERGSNLSLIISEEHRVEDSFDVHQIGGTIYSILDQNDDAYLAARAIQFFAPGIPQVYYVGLLAGENDYKAVDKTGEIREINRHNYTIEEIKESLQKEVVKRLLKLIKFRNEYPAFNGEFKVLDSKSDEIYLSWEKEIYHCTLYIDLNTYKSVINYVDEKGQLIHYVV